MNRFWILIALFLVALLALWGCSNDTSNGPVDPGDGPGGTDKTCLGCHSDEDMLKAALGDTSKGFFMIGNKDDG
jgi:hypothetical protein